MNKKLTYFLGVFLVLLMGIVGADLVFNPTSVDFGTIIQGNNGSASSTITNNGPDNITDISFSAGDFSYNNQFIGTYLMSGTVTFDPSTIGVLNVGDQTNVNIYLDVPINTKMGQYTSTFTTNYKINDTPQTPKQFTANVLVGQYTGSNGDIRITSSSFNYIPSQLKTGKTHSLNLDVQNTGATELSNIKVIVWIYDKSINQIVAYDETITTSIGAGRTENFFIDIDAHQNINADNTFDIYAKAYQIDNELNQHDVKLKTVDMVIEGDLCDIGDLRITELDLDDDTYEPEQTIQVTVDVENNGFDDIEDVVIEVWLSEQGKTKKIEKEKSDKFDLDADDSDSYDFELNIPDDVDDGDYEVHARAYESGNDDNQCIEEVNDDLTIERPDHKVIVKDITITPSTLSCGDIFNAEVSVKNVGNKDDDAVKVKLINSQLNIEEISDTFSLDKFGKSGDDETIFLSATIPDDADNKEYTITFTLYYDDLSEQKNYAEKITVANCAGTNEEEVIEEEIQDTTTNTDSSNVVYLPTGSAVMDFLESSTAKTIFWIVADIALLIIAIYFVVTLVRRGKK